MGAHKDEVHVSWMYEKVRFMYHGCTRRCDQCVMDVQEGEVNVWVYTKASSMCGCTRRNGEAQVWLHTKVRSMHGCRKGEVVHEGEIG